MNTFIMTGAKATLILIILSILHITMLKRKSENQLPNFGNRIKRAIYNEIFIPFFQPKYTLLNEKIISAKVKKQAKKPKDLSCSIEKGFYCVCAIQERDLKNKLRYKRQENINIGMSHHAASLFS